MYHARISDGASFAGFFRFASFPLFSAGFAGNHVYCTSWPSFSSFPRVARPLLGRGEAELILYHAHACSFFFFFFFFLVDFSSVVVAFAGRFLGGAGLVVAVAAAAVVVVVLLLLLLLFRVVVAAAVVVETQRRCVSCSFFFFFFFFLVDLRCCCCCLSPPPNTAGPQALCSGTARATAVVSTRSGRQERFVNGSYCGEESGETVRNALWSAGTRRLRRGHRCGDRRRAQARADGVNTTPDDHPTHKTRHTTHNTQQTAHNTQHTTHD